MQKMLTPKDIQSMFGLSKRKTYQLVEAKGFPKIKIGKQYYIPEDDLERWVQKNVGQEVKV